MNNALLHLLHLSDPALPIGGFSHSAGLETYVQNGRVHNKPTATNFITAMLSRNLFYTDAALVSLAYTAAASKHYHKLTELDECCTAVKLPEEMRQASKKLGVRLLKIFAPLLPHPAIGWLLQQVNDGNSTGNYCIVFGVLAHAMEIDKQEALCGFYYNAAAGMVTNSVKLIPLGQQDGQAILFELLPLINELAAQSLTPNPKNIGLCCTGFDIRSMQHQDLYSRLYMS
jgi:urease accessory protein